MNKIDKTDTLEVVLTRGRFEVDYYQREYRWGHKQIALEDLRDREVPCAGERAGGCG